MNFFNFDKEMVKFCSRFSPKTSLKNPRIILQQTFLKLFKKLAEGVLSDLKHSATPCVLDLAKRYCSFCKHHINEVSEKISIAKHILNAHFIITDLGR